MMSNRLEKLVKEVEEEIKKQGITTVWAIQKRTRRNILSIYKAILVLFKQGKINVEVLDRSVIVYYRQKGIKEEK